MMETLRQILTLGVIVGLVYFILLLVNHGMNKTKKLLGAFLLVTGADLATPPYPSLDFFWLLPIFMATFKVTKDNFVNYIPQYIALSVIVGIVMVILGWQITGLKWKKIKKKMRL